MAKKVKVTFSVDKDDLVDNELRDCFRECASMYEIPIGQLLSRAMYLASLELHGNANMNNKLRESRDTPLDPNRPLNERFLVDTKTWRGRSPFIQSHGRIYDPTYQYDPDWTPNKGPK